VAGTPVSSGYRERERSPVATVRMSDIAKRLGVSVKTVSNVINDVPGRVSPVTAERVRRAVVELGYRPNLSARRLRSGRSRVIALALPDLRNAYFAELAASVIGAARDRDYIVFIEETGGDLAAELDAARGLRDPLIDGVILSPLTARGQQLAGRGGSLPLVVLTETEVPTGSDHVVFDNVAASQLVTRHLVSQGFRRIGVIGYQTDPSNNTMGQRLLGFRQVIDAAGLQHEPALAPAISAGSYDRAGGVTGMEALLAINERPDAVFCLADVLAVGALHAASRHGLSVPADIAIAGFDGIQDARFMVPTLTTVAADFPTLAQLAVNALVERIEAVEDIDDRTFAVPFELVVGESTQRPGVPIGRARVGRAGH
jgi:DNA-binding LacI/PurR family transcriptional regulator